MVVCWILKKKLCNVENVLHLLDDFLTMDRPDFLALYNNGYYFDGVK